MASDEQEVCILLPISYIRAKPGIESLSMNISYESIVFKTDLITSALKKRTMENGTSLNVSFYFTFFVVVNNRCFQVRDQSWDVGLKVRDRKFHSL